MNAIARVGATFEWLVTSIVSYFLLRFGADQSSRLVASKYIDGNFAGVDGWMSLLGGVALLSIFLLLHPRTHFYTAAFVALLLGLDSLSALTFGDHQTLLVPLLSLGSSIIVLLARKPTKMVVERNAVAEHDEAQLDSQLLERGV